MSGTYEERLLGTFMVTESFWSIRYYFAGPDMRHNGTFVTINGSNINTYIDAYRKNWAEYEALKTQIPEGGSFNKRGLQGMAINVGKGDIYQSGVCVDGWHMPISNEKDLNTLLESFESCTNKAPKIMEWLKNN